MAVYTSGDWHVKAGRESEFVDAWRELAGWSTSEFYAGGWGKLLRNKADATHFVSVAEWPDAQTIEKWRASKGFDERLGKLREFVDEMNIRTLDLAAEVGSTPGQS